MSTPFIGEIRIFAGNFAPRGWAFCWGQTLSIAQNTALFSILGTTYGGNGQTTFALPDLRGRAPVHQGQGPGLPPVSLGEMSGSENVTLLSTEMPAHAHAVRASTAVATSTAPTGNVPAAKPRLGADIYAAPSAQPVMLEPSIAPTGGNQPHSNLQPYLAMNFIIALEGIFPSRN